MNKFEKQLKSILEGYGVSDAEIVAKTYAPQLLALAKEELFEGSVEGLVCKDEFADEPGPYYYVESVGCDDILDRHGLMVGDKVNIVFEKCKNIEDMSCHTWAYRKIRPDETETVRKKMVNEIVNATEYLPEGKIEDDYVDSQQNIYKSLTEDYPDDEEIRRLSTDRNALIKYLKKRDRKLHTLADDIMESRNMKSLLRLYKRYHDELRYTDLEVINGELYEEVGFDEPCRIYGYPEETFSDAEKFIEWIKREESKGKLISRLYLDDDLRNFIDGMCPDMENAIRDYWKRYDNEVVVRFG